MNENDKSEKIDFGNVKPNNAIKNVEEIQSQYEHRNETISIVNRISAVVSIVIVIVLFFIKINNSKNNDVDSVINNQNNSESVTSKSPKTEGNVTTNTCSICGKHFFNHGYEEGTDGVWRELEDPYHGQICSPTCGRKHNEQFNDIAKKYGVDLEEGESNTNNQGDYKTGNDGRVYEQNSCGLCNGTGIEKGRNMSTGQTEGRICPMCDGRGVRGY